MRNSTLIVCACLWLCAGRAPAAAPAPDAAAEKAKIEFLLKAVAESKLAFVRDGLPYDGVKAAAHLREKWGAAGAAVKTARQFIELCATRSSLSAEAYEIILADRKSRVPSAAWLETVLFAHELTRAGLKAEAQGAPTAPTAPACDVDKARALLGRLGHEAFEVREKATLELIQMGPAVAPELARFAAETKNPEVVQRCVRIREAIERPEQTALAVLQYIEKSDATFARPGSHSASYSGRQFSQHLQAKALLNGSSLTGAAKDFIEKIASTSSLRGGAYRVTLPDGAEMDMKDWLAKKFVLE